MQSGQHNAIRSPHPASEQEKQNDISTYYSTECQNIPCKTTTSEAELLFYSEHHDQTSINLNHAHVKKCRIEKQSMNKISRTSK